MTPQPARHGPVAAPHAPSPPPSSGTVVFIGDSITDCDRRSDPIGLGGGYVDIVASTLRERGDAPTVVNTGIAGDRVEHLQQRWQADALDHRPAVLSVFVGVNDTLVAFFRGRPTPPEVFERRYADLLDRAATARVPRLIVVDPFFLGSEDDGVRWREGGEFARGDLDAKRAIVRRLAERHGAAFVPLQEAMSRAARERGRAVVAPDGVHPSAYGHRLIARLWLAAYDGLATLD
ncbi:SGNH/GDSL hydrolase family protein [Rugosimonospora acidiphila]|uniref:SGNH/GDSL hydrolase family protein n=1 Tax=Rugosimonospora acidiphila TaxID=556531 RepID=A0ABP9SAK7_9ACTN